MLKSCFKHTISIYIIIIRDNCILVAIKVRLDCWLNLYEEYYITEQPPNFFVSISRIPWIAIESQSTTCTTSRHRQEENRETRFPWHGIARIVERWRGSRVESRDGCRAYLSSNTAKYFRESGLRALHYVGKLSCTPMYRSTRESAYRKGAAYRPLFATPSCTFKLQGQAVYIGATQSFSLALFFFFFFLFRLPLFHFREFVSKSCTRIMHLSRDERIFRELARVREKREKNKYLDSCEQIILRQYLINI